MPKTEISPSRLADGVTLYYINDGKYKTNYANLYFSMPLTAENATKASLAARLLKRGCKKYPSMAEINTALDMDYAATVSFSAFKEGEKTIFGFSLATMKNEYAPNGEDIFGIASDIVFEVLLNPLTEGEGFVKEYFDSEKKNLRDSIEAQVNNKSSYSRTRFLKEMCEGERYATNGEGDLEVLEGITPEELYAFLKNMIKTAVCDLYFVGSESEERVKDTFGRVFSCLEREASPRIRTTLVPDIKGKDITETMDIAQAHLWIGYRLPVTFSSPDYLKFTLFNMIMGGDVSGKMFMNIREKLSLCYSCYSSIDGMKGIFFAYAGIDPENKEKTLNAFYEELENVRAGRVTDKELEDAKKSYINRMRELQDNPSLLPGWFHTRLESDIPRDPFTDAEAIKALTVDDVVWAANRIVKDTVYFLTKN